MKRIITLSIFLLLSSIGFTQNYPINFETGGFGASWTWATFENGTNPALTFVSNPSATGANTSSTVAKFTALQVGMPWAGCESQNGTSIGSFTLSASNAVVKMMVYKSVISDVGIKFATSTGASSGEIKVANTLINQWEELTFDFSSKIGEPSSTGITQIIIFPDFNLAGRTSNVDVYFDNITFSAGNTLAEPTVAAPTPTKLPADVISLFSNAYTNVAVDTWRTSWSSATLTDIQIAGNNTKKYSGLDFVGIETVTSQININGMDFFEFDLWTPNSTSFRIKLVDFGADGAFGGGNDVEHETTITPTLNGWNHIAIPISSMTGLITKSNIAQLIFASAPVGTSVIYVDNVLFSKSSVVLEPTVAAPTPTMLAANVISLFSNAYTNVAVDTWRTSWSSATLTDIQIVGNDTKKYTGLDFVGIETVSSQININGMDFFEFDLWTPNSTSFRIKLVDFGADGAFGGGNDVEHETTITTPTLNGWNHISIPISAMTGLTTKSNIAQLIFASSPAGTSVAYIDNVLFSKNTVVLEPTVAAPTPTKLSSNVVSLFSNAYTNVPVDTWRTSWSSATLTEVQIAGNDAKKYTGLDFVGVETVANQLNISSMDTFEFDMWTPNSTSFRFKLVDFGADGAFGGGNDVEHETTITPTQNGWNHIAVPISAMTGLTTKSNIAQLIFASSPAGTSIAYIDNVLFSKKSAVGIESDKAVKVGVYPNPSNAVFNITADKTIQNIEVFNSIGQLVFTSNANATLVNIDLSDLPNGLYTLKTTIDGVNSFNKIVKE